jgi:hypothetical protein
MRRNLSQEIHSQSTHHRLNLYSIAAAAAGVSILALVQPAHAKIITTKKTLTIDNGTVFLDLNNDGISDFEFSFTTFRDSKYHAKLTLKGLVGGKVVGQKLSSGYGGPYASALVRGKKIGLSAHFSSAGGKLTIERENHANSAGTYYGNWYFAPNHFLGVKFLIKGQTHYGWIRIGGNYTGIPNEITEYAYETVANKPIAAGATSGTPGTDEAAQQTLAPSLGMLARGTDGLALWRREDELCAVPLGKILRN